MESSDAEIQIVIERATEENSLVLAEINAWSPAVLKTTTYNYPGDAIYNRSPAFATLDATVRAGHHILDARHHILDARECELQMAREKLQDQRKQLDETLDVHPEPEHCYCEWVQTSNRHKDWGGADYKQVCSRQTIFNIREGWDYRSRIPLHTTFYQNGGHAIRHVKH